MLRQVALQLRPVPLLEAVVDVSEPGLREVDLEAAPNRVPVLRVCTVAALQLRLDPLVQLLVVVR